MKESETILLRAKCVRRSINNNGLAGDHLEFKILPRGETFSIDNVLDTDFVVDKIYGIVITEVEDLKSYVRTRQIIFRY